jgi:preprotein translocase subunit SecE
MKKENIMKRMRSFFTDVKSELKKVTWPNRNDLQKTTIAVIVLSVIFGIYLKSVDYIFQWIVQHVIGVFK